MKIIFKYITGLSLVLLLTACSNGSSEPSEAEKNMAEMMGITVEELRNQTPEEHMKMMEEMMNDDEKAPVDDHHAGEENVEPHDHDEHGNSIYNNEDNLPPSRSRLEQDDDHHAGEENVEPHDH